MFIPTCPCQEKRTLRCKRYAAEGRHTTARFFRMATNVMPVPAMYCGCETTKCSPFFSLLLNITLYCCHLWVMGTHKCFCTPYTIPFQNIPWGSWNALQPTSSEQNKKKKKTFILEKKLNKVTTWTCMYMHIYTQYIHTYAYITTILQGKQACLSGSYHIHNVALSVYIFRTYRKLGKGKKLLESCVSAIVCPRYIASVPG